MIGYLVTCSSSEPRALSETPPTKRHPEGCHWNRGCNPEKWRQVDEDIRGRRKEGRKKNVHLVEASIRRLYHGGCHDLLEDLSNRSESFEIRAGKIEIHNLGWQCFSRLSRNDIPCE